MKWALLLGLLLVLPTQAQTGAKIVTAARQQVGVTLTYDPAYVTLKFPSGDVPRDRGVCTDVVIRALRDGLAQDLQALVNADMRAHFAVYPQQWGLSRTDRNIDHRRVPNLQTLFKRRGLALKLAKPPDPAAFQPGDLVTCTVPPHLPHIMIVSDRKTPDGTRPLVIHNIGAGAREEDSLLTYPLTGHYRWRCHRSLQSAPPVVTSKCTTSDGRFLMGWGAVGKDLMCCGGCFFCRVGSYIAAELSGIG